jgi:hypothetical protein
MGNKLNLKIREDFRRDGLAANFLVDEKMMEYDAKAFPGSIINIGYPAICSEENKAVKRILDHLKEFDIEVAVVGHAIKSHIDIMGEVIAPYHNASANFWIPVSTDFINKTLNKDPKEILKNALELVKYFKKKWPEHIIDVALTDVTLKEPDIEKRTAEFSRRLHEAGARSIIICDSRGIATPEIIENLFREIRKETSGELEFHPHNDNGLALKNIERAVKFDIRRVGVSLFRAGERNTMLDPRELIKAGYKIEYRSEYLKELEREYREKIGDPYKISELVFGETTIVTGSQYRLRGRFKDAKLLFGVTSDKFILSKLLEVEKEKISDKMMEELKNRLYKKRKIFFKAEELNEMRGELLGELRQIDSKDFKNFKIR